MTRTKEARRGIRICELCGWTVGAVHDCTKPKVSRAVQRIINPGSEVRCTRCAGRVMFRARLNLRQIVCNVYRGKKWVRVEHFHPECYREAGEPYGPPDASNEQTDRR